ncbi:hypothetical protein LUX05_22335 [Streptomyces somaliensis]|nr:hypothetical protein [Streptomyces somaliensis]
MTGHDPLLILLILVLTGIAVGYIQHHWPLIGASIDVAGQGPPGRRRSPALRRHRLWREPAPDRGPDTGAGSNIPGPPRQHERSPRPVRNNTGHPAGKLSRRRSTSHRRGAVHSPEHPAREVPAEPLSKRCSAT